MKKVLKVLLIIILVLIILGGIAVGLGLWYIKSKLSKINYVNIDKSEISINDGVSKNLGKYRNIVLLGLDSREDSYSGSRSDCIIIATIDQNTKKVKLTSVYRDTYLEISDYKLDKVTHAYAFGGAVLTMSTLNENLDLNITEFVTVNFESTKAIINAIGGIDIEIDSDEVNHIPGIYSTGVQHLNGEQALAYARIRYAAGGDYKRTERMRTVVTAVFDKAKTMSITELNKLADTVLPEIYTNITANEIMTLIPEITKYKVTESIGWPYEVRAYETPTWYGVPVTLESCVKQLHKEVFNNSNYEPSDKVKETSKKIIEETGYIK